MEWENEKSLSPQCLRPNAACDNNTNNSNNSVHNNRILHMTGVRGGFCGARVAKQGLHKKGAT